MIKQINSLWYVTQFMYVVLIRNRLVKANKVSLLKVVAVLLLLYGNETWVLKNSAAESRTLQSKVSEKSQRLCIEGWIS